MCLGIPGKVLEKRVAQEGALASALVQFEGLSRPVCIALVPEVEPGEYVVVHAGIALSRMDADEAERLLEHLRGMGEQEGDGDEIRG